MLAATPALDWSSSVRSSSEAFASGESNNWRTTPNAKSRSSSVPRDRSTSIPSSAAVPRAAASSAVLPIPAGPSITRNLPRPDRASSSADSRWASSSFRSRSVAQASSPGRAGASETATVNVSRPYGALKRPKRYPPSRKRISDRSPRACARPTTHIAGKTGGEPRCERPAAASTLDARNHRCEGAPMSTTLNRVLVADLSGEICGSVLGPQDAGYNAARAVHNGLVDRRPAVIVRCRTTNDVVAALAFARRMRLEVSVRGGGHNVAGRAVTDGGVMIDLAEMKAIAIDPDRAIATAEGGVLWGELNDTAAKHGLGVTGGAVSGTGIAGYTLGGGLGWLMAKYGLGADNLVAVELVTAEGDILHVDAAAHPDLFWALRGGGGNFGIATSFTYRLHPVGTIVGGLIAHPIAAAPELLRFYRDAVADASDELTVFAGLVHAPDGSGTKLAALVVFHPGDPDEAERDLAPFKTWGSPLVVEVGAMPYPMMNTLLDGAFPAGSLNYCLSIFRRGLPDDLIDISFERFAGVPSAMTSILLEHFHGAVTRIGPTETAVPHRDPGWNLLIPSVWTQPADTAANIAWTRDTFATMRAHFGTGRWLNYLGDDQAEEAIRAAYGANYDRLVDVKRRYDPDNVFHLNHNIAPC